MVKFLLDKSSLGRIDFNLIKNRDEVRNAISNLLIDRQTHKGNSSPIMNVSPSNAEELKKYKDLLVLY